VTTTSGRGGATGAAALLQPDRTIAATKIDTLTTINRLAIEFDPPTGW